MEENYKADRKNLPGHPEGCYCYGCSGYGYGYGGHWRRFSLLRVLIGLALVFVAFCLGTMVGRWHGENDYGRFRAGGFYGRGMMQGGPPMYWYPQMMGSGQTPLNTATTTPPKK